MVDHRRFGRKLPLPSTVEIIHELRLFILADKIKALQAEVAGAAAPERSVEPAPRV